MALSGAAGGGYAQVVPMDDINLHFTGDMHAITAANNLLSAMIDNHIHQGNELQIDRRQLSWTRVLDMNDRALRNVTVALWWQSVWFPREDHFMITVASEIMAILCLAKDLEDLKERFGRIVIGCNLAGEPCLCSSTWLSRCDGPSYERCHKAEFSTNIRTYTSYRSRWSIC